MFNVDASTFYINKKSMHVQNECNYIAHDSILDVSSGLSTTFNNIFSLIFKCMLEFGIRGII
jgi:hypothetical protein